MCPDILPRRVAQMPDPAAKARLLDFMFTARFDSDGKF
jgi:hypothetical protein